MESGRIQGTSMSVVAWYSSCWCSSPISSCQAPFRPFRWDLDVSAKVQWPWPQRIKKPNLLRCREDEQCPCRIFARKASRCVLTQIAACVVGRYWFWHQRYFILTCEKVSNEGLSTNLCPSHVDPASPIWSVRSTLRTVLWWTNQSRWYGPWLKTIVYKYV